MPIHSRKNLYRGVNAHLHSHLQHEEGSWKVFHCKHIADLAEAIDAQLPPGYEVGLANSLQSVVHDATPREESDFSAVIIWRLNDQNEPESAIAHIELLCPHTKATGGAAQQTKRRTELFSYPSKRRTATLAFGIVLVELDYLHETRPLLHAIPSYPDRQENAFPYCIIVSDPRSSFQEARIFLYPMFVDNPLPVVSLPLAGQDTLTLNFGTIYQQTFASLRYFSNRVDYAAEPEHMETYSAADQERIRILMKRAAETSG